MTNKETFKFLIGLEIEKIGKDINVGTVRLISIKSDVSKGFFTARIERIESPQLPGKMFAASANGSYKNGKPIDFIYSF